MGLYNFKPQFVPFILDGRKCHTIRGHRKHPDSPGNTLHLYTGLRTKNVRLVLRAHCTKVEDIRIALAPGGVPVIYVSGNHLSGNECEALARRDGFRDFAEMMHFWDGRLPFSGQIIHWRSPKVEQVERARQIRNLLELVSCVVPLSAIRSWSEEQIEAGSRWAVKSFLKANDNNVRVPPLPEFLKQYVNKSRFVGSERRLN